MAWGLQGSQIYLDRQSKPVRVGMLGDTRKSCGINKGGWRTWPDRRGEHTFLA